MARYGAFLRAAVGASGSISITSMLQIGDYIGWLNAPYILILQLLAELITRNICIGESLRPNMGHCISIDGKTMYCQFGGESVLVMVVGNDWHL